MKKILVILTGGTIGSRVEGEEMDVTADSPYKLLAQYQDRYGKDHEFEVIQPFTILSENMTLSFWNRLCSCLWDIPYEAYDGIILTHGSDTLSYTAALLGLVFCHIPVPLILIASNYPLGEKGSNGLANFRSAVELIDTHMVKGVFCVYQNNKGENNVYLATRMTEADPYLDQFGSFGGVPLGTMEEGTFRYLAHPVNPSLRQIREERRAVTAACPVFRRPVLMLRAYPGLDYGSVDLRVKPAAVLHYLYHSATACIRGEGTALPGFISRCREMGIPVYAASAKSLSGRQYVTAKEIREQGAVLLQNISPEAAYAKTLLFSQPDLTDQGKGMEAVYYFENLPFPAENL